MKFKDQHDKNLFFSEAGRFDLIGTDTDVSEAEFGPFLKKRMGREKRVKNFRQSQITKSLWNQSRWKYMRGIRKFHRSIEGKRFHKSLGRFLATRIFRPKALESMPSVNNEALKAVTSLRTHLYIEQEYYMPMEESVSFKLLLDYAVPKLCEIENKLFEAQKDLDDEDLELLCRFLEPKEFVSRVCGIDASDKKHEAILDIITRDDEDSFGNTFLLDIARLYKK